MARDQQNILLTGRPGVGKTTVVVRLTEILPACAIGGFFTKEIRQRRRREGFEATTLAGETATLAHRNIKSKHRVGAYGVDLAAFEALVLPMLAAQCDLMLIDEVGKMECFSAGFVGAVRELLDSETTVIATVASRGVGFIEEVKRRADTEMIEVTAGNRDELPMHLAHRIRKSGC